MEESLSAWMQSRIEYVVVALQVLAILLAAWALRWLVRRLIARLAARYELPPMVVMGARRVATFLIGMAALLMVLERFGVSAGVLWGAFTGFAAVAAVAFFAAWSVLTNIFCSFLILVTRPFRLFDHIEVLDNGEKPGLGGQVIDINLVYVTLLERHADGFESQLRVPNSQFFQRAVRRWSGEPPPPRAADGGARRCDDKP
ncbi:MULTISPECIES: mechanosensitive ion channel domain-containing protein [Thermomonas]|jgi:small-conductance mechanosensitive channel|uniref:mechanosensitive ion channel domain-containing protein n=1 Tax=Thermomonas TaxID=141948 RepID=UPI000414AFD4|nr:MULTISPECIES: mechanosensitive ion channel domain-containing protein [Thermomonas]QNU16194.1 mechanosensitive ion channel [Thermomonas sp. XSG]